MKHIKLSLFIAVYIMSTVVVSVGTAQAVLAASPVTQMAACGSQSSFFGFPSWDACLPKDAKGAPTITSLDDVWKIAFPIIETMIKAAGYMAVGFIIWGGIKYTKSRGEPGNISSAQQTIQNAIIGLIITILSVALVRFIADRF